MPIVTGTFYGGIRPSTCNLGKSHDVNKNTCINNGNKDKILAFIHKKGKAHDQILNPKTDLNHTIGHIKGVTNLEMTTVKIIIIIIKIMMGVAITKPTNPILGVKNFL